MDSIRALTISDLSAGYSNRPVLRGMHLAPLEPGKVTALVGPNAAGKSTLLRALAGLIPAKGSVRLGDLDLNALSLAKRAQHVAFMPQTLPQNAELSVLEGVIGALKASPLADFDGSGPETRHRAVDALDRLGILDLAMEGIGRLSGGQRQLASLAQAIVRAPDLLLLDEPTSALDLRHQLDVMTIVRELAREGRIVVVVLHDLTLAASWADHLVVLDRGTVVAEGPPEEALSPSILSGVYGVEARVERCSRGRLHIMVDGPAASSEIRHAS
ncbi:ABC transporter ATP-binding protein [Mesorhizobium sp. YR577]|uniref:ABC transporter ATP-binding protein n=1 Tax=Mesorhizobium sp. YR577 TaxID=1884373 RepID=UPI0008E01F78|nr:ABC transporter ATP-binding protein [Mesorhizobium sp. YR577]SFU22535.1 iron complex transport system ATP-binding protein [Mesorhizobium sp. YR577]